MGIALDDELFHPECHQPNNGERQIASWYYPLIGPYDSVDPAVLEYHVLLMKLAGIDGVIVDWYGQDNYNDYAVNNQRTLALFDHTRKAGLKFSLCYEDATIQAEINGGTRNGLTGPLAPPLRTRNKPCCMCKPTSSWTPAFSAWTTRPCF